MSNETEKKVELNKEKMTENETNNQQQSKACYPDCPYEGYPKPIYSSESGSSVGSLLCGVLSILFCAAPVFPIVASVIGIFLSKENEKQNQLKALPRSGAAVLGNICSIIGLILNILIYIAITIGAVCLGSYLVNTYWH